ncbi:MAG TPA: hypothetical protein VE177_03560 [Candidatus Binatus sp.]|nr:hypothetical protein [Candidatus Binatus sp.]
MTATLNGFNDSRDHSGQSWPVARVPRCSMVTMRLVNQDTSQAHGLAVDLYANNGVIAGPGQAAQVTFRANRSGDYKIVCTIQCSIHKTMLNGLLQVV